ncbi:homoprotocatechuate degradation operon regulator HpaR [Mesobacterium sp. TK19101]|uniref:Homoprotocatechuate degradation operon regulator HpaR n=1 Tax=Mesobacterium hydrothermale TaxID=3111907 RepID=A0ABU6HKV2_9RHOB|nr:homoprotocatechuate degradation operon regulator HpaR [Mesobacterium sp. TK19101]MEC3862506.1 homoprotocatechuate degradation operon regulator HpaR [Mesobacterium sp. TK19101]
MTDPRYTLTQDDFPKDGLQFSETRRSLPMALLMAREAVMERFRPMLHALELTEQQWRVLRVLQESPGSDATLLARKACILAPSLTRMLKALEARTLITIARDPSDARRMILSLSEEGHALLKGAAQDSARLYGEIETAIGRERLHHLLDEIEALLDRLE